MILLIGIVAYYIMVPNIYGSIISFGDWLFTDSQNIINTLKNPNTIFFKINCIIGIKFFCWVWTFGLITSLFFVGKQFQTKSKPDTINSIFIKKEPYLMMQKVTSELKLLKIHKNSEQLDSLIYTVKKLEERLSIESDFGYGQSIVINCENNIAQQIQFLLDTVSCVEEGNFEENLRAMKAAVMDINCLLYRRIELKRK